MKPLSERLDLVDKAIDELGGTPLWHEDDAVFLKRHINMDSSFITGSSSLAESARRAFIYTREEFEQRVKERESMEKYEYMKEYLCSGVKPDLPDDVEIQVKLKNIKYSSEWSKVTRTVGENSWDNGVLAFRIVDDRWKPETKNDWYEKGELPPVDSLVDTIGTNLVYGQGEKECRVRGYVDGVIVVQMSYGYGCFSLGNLKPSKTEEDELVERLAKTIKKAEEANTDLVLANEEYRLIASYAVKDGWRPPKSKD